MENDFDNDSTLKVVCFKSKDSTYIKLKLQCSVCLSVCPHLQGRSENSSSKCASRTPYKIGDGVGRLVN